MEQGYHVIGVTARFVDNPTTNVSIQAASEVAHALGIQHIVWDATEVFERNVIVPFCDQCAQGMTPSPCVFCNRFCKLPVLLAVADKYNAPFVATGHYAQRVVDSQTGRFAIAKAIDTTKDQSYMLAQLTQDQLARLVLPLGNLRKDQVRVLAAERNIPVAHRAESQDLCFVSHDYRDFLLERGLNGVPGAVELRDGSVVGEHQGLHRYTIGQRKGIGIALGKPVFVVDKDTERNVLVLAYKNDAYLSGATTYPITWQAGVMDTDALSSDGVICNVKIRYRSQAVPARLFADEEGRGTVVFDDPQTPTAPGQYATFYHGDIVIGSAPIKSVIFA